MFCPGCGTQNPDGATVCSACASILNVTPPPPPAAYSPDSSAATAPARVYPPLSSVSVASGYPSLASAPKQKTMSVLGIIGIPLIILLALAYAFAAPLPDLPNETQAVGYRIGTVFGALGIPFLIAYLIAGRRKARNPNLFAGLFCGIAFCMIFANAATNLGPWTPETTDQKTARLMREAAGVQPVRRTMFGENKIDAKLRGFFKDILALNKEYQEAISKLDTSETKKLSTPESFADPDSAADGLKQFHAACDLDAHQEERMLEIVDKFKHSFDDLSASERQEMLEGFQKGLGQAMPVREHAVASEKAWLDAMDDAYDYARAHHADIRMVDGRLGVVHDDVRAEFNTRIRTLNARRTEFLQAKHAIDEIQSRELQKIGVNPQQLGLH